MPTASERLEENERRDREVRVGVGRDTQAGITERGWLCKSIVG